MKKVIILAALFMAALFTFQPQTSFASRVKKELTTEEQATLDSIQNRVEEIKHMDKSTLSKADKKALKMELKEMKKKANKLGGGGGIYLSVGAILIIILVLILIL